MYYSLEKQIVASSVERLYYAIYPLHYQEKPQKSSFLSGQATKRWGEATKEKHFFLYIFIYFSQKIVEKSVPGYFKTKKKLKHRQMAFIIYFRSESSKLLAWSLYCWICPLDVYSGSGEKASNRRRPLCSTLEISPC